jgi:AcrR family transcriptional regulator
MAARAPGASSESNGAASESTGRRRDREVLEAATHEFYRRGYASATVQNVADALGMLKGSLYYYIRSKEDLLYRVASGVHDDVDRLLAETMTLEGLTALQRLEEYVRRQITHNLGHLEAISVYYHDVDRLGSARRKEIGERRDRHQALIVSLVRLAQDEGDVSRDADPVLLSHCLFATVIWIYRWYRPRAGLDTAEIVDTCTAFVVRGLSGHEAISA